LIDLCCIILFVGATSGSICAIESGSESNKFELRYTLHSISERQKIQLGK
jgi:hypothetical protein